METWAYLRPPSMASVWNRVTKVQKSGLLINLNEVKYKSEKKKHYQQMNFTNRI